MHLLNFIASHHGFIASHHGFLSRHTTHFYRVTPRIFMASHHGFHGFYRVTLRILSRHTTDYIASHHGFLLRHITDFYRVVPAMTKDLGFEVSSVCYKQGGMKGIRLLYPESAIHREAKLENM